MKATYQMTLPLEGRPVTPVPTTLGLASKGPFLPSGETPEILKLLDSKALIFNVKSLAQKEKSLTVQIVDYLSEIYRRRAFMPKFTSLFTFLVEELGYCPSTAALRINTIKAFSSVPEIRKKVIENQVSLNAVTKTQSFINQENREAQDQNRPPLSPVEQAELFAAIESTPSVDLEKALNQKKREIDCRKAESAGLPPPPPKPQSKKISLEVDAELQAMIDELKSLLSHSHSGLGIAAHLKKALPLAIRELKISKGLIKRSSAGKTELHKNDLEQRSEVDINTNVNPLVANGRITLESKNRFQGQGSIDPKMAEGVSGRGGIDRPEAANIKGVNPPDVISSSGTRSQPVSSLQTPSPLTSPSLTSSSSFVRHVISRQESNAHGKSKLAGNSNRNDKIEKLGKDQVVVSRVTRAIPFSIKQKVWERDRGCCQHVDPQTMKKCESKHQVQLDHIKPWAMGGEHSVENIRLVCAVHNRYRAGIYVSQGL